jgi:hypothetical protein
MRRSKPRLNWDRLLDGNTYVLDLHEIEWPGSLNDLRSKAHYEADRRRGIATTRKLGVASLEVKGEGMPRPPRDPCTCGAPVWDFHIITCRSLGANAATQIGGPALHAGAPSYYGPTPGPLPTPRQTQAPSSSLPAPMPSPFADDPLPELTEEEEEELLGPCTCGQRPICLPSCARAGGDVFAAEDDDDEDQD